MRVESTPPYSPPVSPESGSKVTSGRTSPTPQGGADAVGFSQTPDLTKLVALVSSVPETRADLVQEVSDRAAIGELQSRTAAVDTAAAMLDTQDNS